MGIKFPLLDVNSIYTSRYKLTKTEIDFLIRGHTGSYRPHELRNRIAEKATRTPARLQGLCADIDALHRRGYLDENEIEFAGVLYGKNTSMDAIANVFERPDYRHEDDSLDDSVWYSRTLIASKVAPYELGIDIGQMVNHVTEDTDHVKLLSELVCGFIEGLCYYDRILYEDMDEVDVEHRIDLLNEVSDKLLSTQRADHTVRVENSKEQYKEIRQRVKAAVSDKSDVKWWTDKVMSYALRDFMNADPKGVTSEYVDDIIEERNLRETYRLEIELEAAMERLQTQRYKGIGASDVIESLDGTEKSSKRIAEDIDGHAGGVTVVAQSLSGVDKNRHGVRDDAIWSNKPIVEGDKDGWVLTAYGEVVAQHLSTF